MALFLSFLVSQSLGDLGTIKLLTEWLKKMERTSIHHLLLTVASTNEHFSKGPTEYLFVKNDSLVPPDNTV